MTATAIAAGPHRPCTVDDPEAMPDDGRRYELIDGNLLGSPVPGFPHQQVAMQLGVLLVQHRPSDLRVLGTRPFQVRVVPADLVTRRRR